MVFSIGYTSTPVNHHQLILWKEHEGAFQVLVYLIFILYNLILQHYQNRPTFQRPEIGERGKTPTQ